MAVIRGADDWYSALLAGSAFWSAISAVLLQGVIHEEGARAAWFWAASFLASSLVAALCFGELL